MSALRYTIYLHKPAKYNRIFFIQDIVDQQMKAFIRQASLQILLCLLTALAGSCHKQNQCRILFTDLTDLTVKCRIFFLFTFHVSISFYPGTGCGLPVLFCHTGLKVVHHSFADLLIASLICHPINDRHWQIRQCDPKSIFSNRFFKMGCTTFFIDVINGVILIFNPRFSKTVCYFLTEFFLLMTALAGSKNKQLYRFFLCLPHVFNRVSGSARCIISDSCHDKHQDSQHDNEVSFPEGRPLCSTIRFFRLPIFDPHRSSLPYHHLAIL